MSANVASIKMTELRCMRSSMSTPRRLHRTKNILLFIATRYLWRCSCQGCGLPPFPYFVGVVVDFTSAAKMRPKIQGFYPRIFKIHVACMNSQMCGGGHPGEKRTFPSPMPIVGIFKRLMFIVSYRFVIHQKYGWYIVRCIRSDRVGLQWYDCTRILQCARS